MVASTAVAEVAKEVLAPVTVATPTLGHLIITNGRAHPMQTGPHLVIRPPEKGTLKIETAWEMETVKCGKKHGIILTNLPGSKVKSGVILFEIWWESRFVQYARSWSDASVSPEWFSQANALARRHNIEDVIHIHDYQSWAHNLRCDEHELHLAVTALQQAGTPTTGQNVFNWVQHHAKH